MTASAGVIVRFAEPLYFAGFDTGALLHPECRGTEVSNDLSESAVRSGDHFMTEQADIADWSESIFGGVIQVAVGAVGGFAARGTRM